MSRYCFFRLLLAVTGLLLVWNPASAADPDPLLDWSLWQRFRATVRHPALAIKPHDLQRAHENMIRQAWARGYRNQLESEVIGCCDRLTSEFLVRMIPETTPLSEMFTPCPACREQGKPFVPHGQWRWNIARPEQLQCAVCETVYPNSRYPETVRLRSTWGKPQILTFYGGKPFAVFTWKSCRPSFSGNIRCQKVRFMAELARKCAEAHALTGKALYAHACRRILLRMAEVYPSWLVHTGYGEFADEDPHVASYRISNLAKTERTYPPNQPDYALHAGYWSAGRATGSGEEGEFLLKVAQAYDLTCEAREDDGSPVFNEAERMRIEKDLLLEATVLLGADKSINNKTAANRTAVGLVGICVGHPELMRFAMEGFDQTINRWFLPDGATSESPLYAGKVLGGLREFLLACRSYSDPQGYTDSQDKRYDHLDLYQQSRLVQIWDAMFSGLQGDLYFPPYADSHREAQIAPRDAELLAANYPGQPRYLALLKELCGPAGNRMHIPSAIYYRDPLLEERSKPALVFCDVCLPELRIGHMRTGSDGRESLLLLSASPWKGHHHFDSLNLYYWKNGQELLTDLGYLWDHPQYLMTARAFAHNLVLIDQKEQRNRYRGGEVHFFHSTPNVKVMRASSLACAQASLYCRTSAIIDHGNRHSYVVDFFDVRGGNSQDYVFHGPNNSLEVENLSLRPCENLVYDLTRTRTSKASGAWVARWQMSGESVFSVWNIGQNNERVYLGDGWGQRDHNNRDAGVTVPYIVRRCIGRAARHFVSVFEEHRAGAPWVKSVRRMNVQKSLADEVVALEVTTAEGTDYIVSALQPKKVDLATKHGPVRSSTRFYVASFGDSQLKWSFAEPQKP